MQDASGGSIFTKKKSQTPALCRPSAWGCLWRMIGATSDIAYTTQSHAA